MLMPKRVKYRKVQRGRMRGNSKGGHQVAFGEYGLKALEEAGSRTARSRRLAWP